MAIAVGLLGGLLGSWLFAPEPQPRVALEPLQNKVQRLQEDLDAAYRRIDALQSEVDVLGSYHPDRAVTQTEVTPAAPSPQQYEQPVRLPPPSTTTTSSVPKRHEDPRIRRATSMIERVAYQQEKGHRIATHLVRDSLASQVDLTEEQMNRLETLMTGYVDERSEYITSLLNLYLDGGRPERARVDGALSTQEEQIRSRIALLVGDDHAQRAISRLTYVAQVPHFVFQPD